MFGTDVVNGLSLVHGSLNPAHGGQFEGDKWGVMALVASECLVEPSCADSFLMDNRFGILLSSVLLRKIFLKK
jgi:hypothetical protein